jgi:hypothetical protein
MHALGPTEPWNQRPGVGVLPDPTRPSVRVATLQSQRSSVCCPPIATPKTRHRITAQPERTDFLYIHYDRHKQAWSCEQTPNRSNDPLIGIQDWSGRVRSPIEKLPGESDRTFYSIRIRADDLTAVSAAERLPCRNIDRVFDELHVAVGHQCLNAPRVVATRGDVER